MKNDDLLCENDFVHFDGISLEAKRPTARFRIAAQWGYAGGQTILDKNGDLQEFYHVKACDLQKRRRKLVRQGIDPIETDRAIDNMINNGVKEAYPRHRFPPPRGI